MKPLSVLEALVLTQVGWTGEEQRRLHNKALDVLHAAAAEVRDAHREYPERRLPVTWLPSDKCRHANTAGVTNGVLCLDCGAIRACGAAWD